MGEAEEQQALQEFVDGIQELVQSKLGEGLEHQAIAYAMTYVATAFSMVVAENSIGGFPVMFEAMSSAIGEAQSAGSRLNNEAVH